MRSSAHRLILSQSRIRRAFSLVEIMVVVVIIGLLAGTVAISVGGYVDRARTNRARSDISTLVTAVESFYATESRYPSNEEGLSVLPIESQTDPWGNPYQYNTPGRDGPYEIVSYGADAAPGGDGQNTDIISSELGEGSA
ncbi:MAG: type II secretion system major pseudopilin GspG [Planctomycetota bacterium]